MQVASPNYVDQHDDEIDEVPLQLQPPMENPYYSCCNPLWRIPTAAAATPYGESLLQR